MNAQQPLRLTDFTTVDITVERIGAGGFGLVFMGPDRFLGRWRAIKTLRAELLALRLDMRDLFLRECLTWVGLRPHVNLLTADGATEINGRIYLRLEYAEHGSLRDLLALKQPFATRLVWAQHVAAGLLALHTPDPEFLRPVAMIHRDLKPDNVLIDAMGIAVITDFGLAAAVRDALAQSPTPADALEAFALIEQLAEQGGQVSHTTHATRTARFHTHTLGAGAISDSAHAEVVGLGGVGTIAYMPPEQWIDGGEVGTPADLYAFGLILSELLAGRHGLADLESNLDEDSWYHLHLNGTPRPLRNGPAEGASRLPQEVEQLYQGLLAKRPEDRPTTDEALTVLQQGAIQLGEDPYTMGPIPLTDAMRLEMWNDWASTCFRFDRLEEALARNDRALAIDPHNFNTLHTQGAIVGRMGLIAQRQQKAGQVADSSDHLQETALGWYDQALSAATSDTEYSLAQGTRAAQLTELGRYAEAEQAYTTALALSPNDGNKWYNRTNNALRWVRAEVEAGRNNEAMRLYAMAESYAQEAQRVGFNHPNVFAMLTDIQRERALLEL